MTKPVGSVFKNSVGGQTCWTVGEQETDRMWTIGISVIRGGLRSVVLSCCRTAPELNMASSGVAPLRWWCWGAWLDIQFCSVVALVEGVTNCCGPLWRGVTNYSVPIYEA